MQSKASVQGHIIPVMSGKKRQSTNTHEMISLTVVFLPEGVTESAKVFMNTILKECNRRTVQITYINSSMQNKITHSLLRSKVWSGQSCFY